MLIMPKGKIHNLDIKVGDIKGNWVIVSGPVWTFDNKPPTVVARCLGCNEEFTRIAYQFTHKGIKNTGCSACVLRLRRARGKAPDGDMICLKCGEKKAVTCFHNDKRRFSGKYPWCKPCANAYTLPIKKRHRENRDSPFMRTSRKYRDRMYFGDDTIFHALIEKQGNKCAICKKVYVESDVPRFHIDHCHKTRTIRGVLCPSCNKALGNAKDSIVILRRMIEYLESNENIPILSGLYSKE